MKISFRFPQTSSAARTALRTLVVLAGFVGTFAARPALAQVGQQPQPVAVEKMDETSFRVRISNPQQKAGTLEIVNLANGRTLFKEGYTGVVHGHKFNFRDMQDGKYAVVVKVGKEKFRYELQLQTTTQRTVAMNVTPESPAAPAVMM
ncbi:hypothetical protein LJY25_02975 [Hymenobacter sp. BT175]|uniref:hypothetical protein n=1 Tax=Hymenobacter translucens TaxID=2886507 RepID=UPI001D0E2479|nr:hypothetical protein [Hymenobacter translucens]MCC2545394.1 hypothetical protein [Hymenobacter translucens]